MGSQDLKTLWKNVWHFLWEDNSVWSWIINIILAFVLIKFLVYPALGLLLGTKFPIVAVISGSMEHAYTPRLDPQGNLLTNEEGDLLYALCDDQYAQQPKSVNGPKRVDFEVFWRTCGAWYAQQNITKEQFNEFPFDAGFEKGDIMILMGRNTYKIGDILVFQSPIRSEPIIHRIVAIHEGPNGMTYQTKGDHNDQSHPFEQYIPYQMVYGKAIFRIPYLGYVKILAVNILNSVR